ncbi:hypothetical protein FNV43_RR11713 [Rhamnella rubrinervis]|uniref:Uncharacterized protein n=1 Tax=Rhamnella rubrinervis TaxID=2594499 RepID=A0A8K0H6X7_9ROSA|nr:hypothetical protein FNV43_RR11713 [Rhamnella rubrinervis]
MSSSTIGHDQRSQQPQTCSSQTRAVQKQISDNQPARAQSANSPTDTVAHNRTRRHRQLKLICGTRDQTSKPATNPKQTSIQLATELAATHGNTSQNLRRRRVRDLTELDLRCENPNPWQLQSPTRGDARGEPTAPCPHELRCNDQHPTDGDGGGTYALQTR